MHTVIQTPTFLAHAKAAGVDETELDAICDAVARAPKAGDLIPGAGGARKVRVGGKGKGKSGGYRVITYFAADDVPAERNALRDILGTLADIYRAGVRAKVRQLTKPRP